MESQPSSDPRKKEIYTHKAPWPTYAMAWSRGTQREDLFRLIVASCKEEYSNKVEILRLHRQNDSPGGEREKERESDRVSPFEKLCEFEHPYPATKVMWCPPREYAHQKDLLATTGDYLRLWELDPVTNAVEMKTILNNNRHTDYCAPLTSFDWNEADPGMIGTCAIDTTCTIWDVETSVPRTQLIAHDKEVYDMAFATGRDLFATVGADGSLRMFDLRHLEHSTILYESPDLTPLLRVVWNKLDPNYIATVLCDSAVAIIIDIRVPSIPVQELAGHRACLNGITWAPHSSVHLCTVSDDKQALIWDVSGSSKNRPMEDPILSYTAGGEINQVYWGPQHEEWVSICYDDCVQVLRV
mmetsp:Transcript_2912/g.3069  ORF Transcript_2912/g.3069 Transcript_2912/m.3069 type:complete len:356 (-) Transcript_2912:204-1271(-)